MRGGPRTSKLGNVHKIYNGAKYPSVKQARYAAQLDLRLAAGEIKGWRQAKSIFLTAGGAQLYSPKGRRQLYRPDFEITHLDDSIELIEVKGSTNMRYGAYPYHWLKREIVRVMGITIKEV